MGNLYQLLKEQNLIESETWIEKPQRVRPKVMGWMWEGKSEVILKNGLKLIFYFWYHFGQDDDSKDWFPSEQLISDANRPQFVPQTPSSDAKLVDATWRLFNHDNHYYISKNGTFELGEERRNEILQSLKDGSWVSDSDLWQLV